MTEIESAPGIPPKPEESPTYSQSGANSEVHETGSSPKSPKVGRRRFPPFWGKASRTTLVGAYPIAVSPQGANRRGGPRKISWYWASGAALVFLAGGIAIGATLPDPRKSEEYIALQSQKEGVSADLTKLQSLYNTLNSSISGRESTISTKESALTVRESEVKAAEANVKKREEAVTAAEKTKAANTVREGTWTVGTDIEPGTYRTTADVSGSCYWGIYRTGSNGADIVDNDIVTGGRPSVTLSVGQDFKSSRCGAWLKQ